MVVVCEGCQRRFQVDEARIPAQGARVRCKRCNHRFRVVRPDATQGAEVSEEETTLSGSTIPEMQQDVATEANQELHFVTRVPGVEEDAPSAAEESSGAEGETPAGANETSGIGDTSVAFSEGSSAREDSSCVAEQDVCTEVEGSPASAEAPTAGAEVDNAAAEASSQTEASNVVDHPWEFAETSFDENEGQAAERSDDPPIELELDSQRDFGAGSEPPAGHPIGIERSSEEMPDSGLGLLERLVRDEEQPEDAGASLSLEGEDDAAADLEGGPGAVPSGAPQDGAPSGPPLDGAPSGPPQHVFKAELDLPTPATPPPVEAPPQPPPPTGRWTGHVGWASAMLLLLAVAHGSVRIQPTAGDPAPGSIDLTGLRLEEVRGRWVDNAVDGTLYVVSGVLHNPGPDPRTPGQMMGVRLLDAGGQEIDSGRAVVAPSLPETAVRELDADTLAAVQERAARTLARTSIAPGGELPFDAVVGDLPETAHRFRVGVLPQVERKAGGSFGKDGAPEGS